MKVLFCFAAVALAAAGAPTFAGGSGPAAGASEPRSLPPLSVREPAAVGLRLAPAVGDGRRPGSSLTLAWEDSVILRPCSLEIAAALELTPPPAAAPVYPSLGGPSRTVTSPEALPSLRDETRQTDPDDTLRLLRSRW